MPGMSAPTLTVEGDVRSSPVTTTHAPAVATKAMRSPLVLWGASNGNESRLPEMVKKGQLTRNDSNQLPTPAHIGRFKKLLAHKPNL